VTRRRPKGGQAAMRFIIVSGVLVFAFLLLTAMLLKRNEGERASPGDRSSPFDGKRAFRDLERIVGLGPRASGSPELDQLRGIIRRELETVGLEVREQAFRAETPIGSLKMVNIWGTVKGTRPGVIVLGNHYETKYFPEFRLIKDLMETGEWGRVQAAHFKRIIAQPAWWDAKELERTGGPAIDLHIHDSDFIQFLFGMPAAVTSSGFVRKGVIEHLSIDPKYYFGFESRNGLLWATPEKAFLDVCYYRYKGKMFSFDPASDINYQDLDHSLITDYLARFDQRFVTYFSAIWKAP